MKLIDIGLNVDTSELESRLDGIDQKLADLGGEDILDEDRVEEIVGNMGFVEIDDLDDRVQGVIDNGDLVSRDDVEQIVRDLMHSEGDDFVQNVIDNGSYVTESEVEGKVREMLDDTTPDEDAVRTIVESVTDGRLQKLEDRLAQIEERNATAMTFFDLIQQAFALLRR